MRSYLPGSSRRPLSTLGVDTPVAVRLQPGDPVKGFIRADEITRTYVPWLTGPVGKITAVTLDALTVALRTEMDLSLWAL
jgi:hypothetical protein